MAGPSITAVVSADDKASAVLLAIGKIALQMAKEFDKIGKDNGLAKGLDAARLSAERTTSSLTRMQQVLHNSARVAKEMAGHMASLAGPAVLHATRGAVMGGAHVNSELVKAQIAGIPAGEIAAAQAQAVDLSARFANVHQSEIIQTYRELRSVLKDTHEVPAMMPTVIQAKSALDAADPSGKGSEGLVFALKAAELLGLASDPAKFKTYIDSFLKAQQVLGKTISAEGIYDFAKYTKASGARFSPEFINSIGPLLTQELGGSTAGTGLDQLEKQIQGGFAGNNHAAAKEFVALGLAQASDFQKTKTGEIKGMLPGKHVVGADIAAADPAKWVWDVLLPALRAKGFDTQDKQIGEVRRLFPNSNANNIVAKLIQQQETFAAHMERIAQAMGLAATDKFKEDAIVGLKALQTSLENFGSTATSPMMKDAGLAMSGLAEHIGEASVALHNWQVAHPLAAKAAAAGVAVGGVAAGSALTYGLISKLFGNAGLKSSALALDGAAASLEAAAVALGRSAIAETGAGATGALRGAAKGARTSLTGRLLKGAAGIAGTVAAAEFLSEPTEFSGHQYTYDESGKPLVKKRDPKETVINSMRDFIADWFMSGGPEARAVAKDIADETRRHGGFAKPVPATLVPAPVPAAMVPAAMVPAFVRAVPAPTYQPPQGGDWRDTMAAARALAKPAVVAVPPSILPQVPRYFPRGETEYDRARDSQRERQRDPEAAHGRAYANLPAAPDLTALAAAIGKPVKVEVAPVTVSGKISGDAQVHVNIDVTGGASKILVPLNLSGNVGNSEVVPAGHDKSRRNLD